MKRTPFHGYSVSDSPAKLHIGSLPGRKQVALYIVNGGELVSLAYFRSEADARTAMDFIDHMVGIKL